MRELPVRHGGALSEAVSRYGGAATDWLDLSTGINPNPAPVSAISMAHWHRLPDADLYTRAEEAAAKHYKCPAGVAPLAAPGTQSIIQILPRLFAETSAKVAIIGPTYGEYAASFYRSNIDVEVVNSLEELTAEHRLVVVVNPNNPDGRVWARKDLIATARRLGQSGGALIVDEAFADVDPTVSLADCVGDDLPNLIVLKSFGKFFGLAGARLGFVLAGSMMRAQIKAYLGPWAVSGPALAIAADLMDDPKHIEQIRAQITIRHAGLLKALTAFDFEFVGGTALFACVSHREAHRIADALAERAILVRSFDYQETWLRFGLTPDARSDERLASALREMNGREALG